MMLYLSNAPLMYLDFNVLWFEASLHENLQICMFNQLHKWDTALILRFEEYIQLKVLTMIPYFKFHFFSTLADIFAV